MAGDNQWHLERALPYGQILGVVDEIVRDGTISFPYTLEKGRTESSDAIMLLSVMGFDKETTDEAKRLSEGYMETGSWEKI